MNENINLCELLKGHEGETFYSPTFGNIVLNNAECSPLYFDTIECTIDIRYDGKYCDEGEVCVFPSKDQRDWNKWVEEQKPKTPKTWSELQTQLGVQFMFTDCKEQGRGENMNIHPNKPIEKSALALLKIHQLIEVGYGGNVKHGEESYHTAGIDNNLNIIISEECDEDIIVFHPLIFHNSEQAVEFLSYPENVQLVKDFYMI